MTIRKVEITVVHGLYMFSSPTYHTLVYEEGEKNPKHRKNNASFADPYKSISKSAKSKNSKL